MMLVKKLATYFSSTPREDAPTISTLEQSIILRRIQKKYGWRVEARADGFVVRVGPNVSIAATDLDTMAQVLDCLTQGTDWPTAGPTPPTSESMGRLMVKAAPSFGTMREHPTPSSLNRRTLR